MSPVKMRVLVVTTVHTPLDARIHHRQIRALRDAGHHVTYAAPWRATGTPPSAALDGIRLLDLPRSVGRARVRSIRRARRLLHQGAHIYDVIVIHDPELLLALPPRTHPTPIVWDVHEDTPASLIDRPWVPASLRPVARWFAARLEAWAETRCHLILAEASYAERFTKTHPFVPNHPWLPEHDPKTPQADRVVYVGRIATSRGAAEILELARRLRGRPVKLEVIGEADANVRDQVAAAHERGELVWHGFVPNEAALELIEGAAAGLSLIHPRPNHAHSLQTEVLEYLSRRVPVITTDLPVTGEFVRSHEVGLVVEVGDDDAVEKAVDTLLSDHEQRQAMAERGFALVRDELNWNRSGARFVQHLEQIAQSAADRAHNAAR